MYALNLFLITECRCWFKYLTERQIEENRWKMLHLSWTDVLPRGEIAHKCPSVIFWLKWKSSTDNWGKLPTRQVGGEGVTWMQMAWSASSFVRWCFSSPSVILVLCFPLRCYREVLCDRKMLWSGHFFHSSSCFSTNTNTEKKKKR